jgi:hypothetical protein
MKQLDADLVFLPGLCGEVARGYFWKKSDLEDRAPITSREILDRIGVPHHEIVLDAAESWLHGLDGLERLEVLDFAYIEQRLGCWAGPSHYGHSKNLRVVPLSDREVFTLMLRLPKKYRFENRLPADLIEALWPELLAIPFNSDVGIRRLFSAMQLKTGRFLKRHPSVGRMIGLRK